MRLLYRLSHPPHRPLPVRNTPFRSLPSIAKRLLAGTVTSDSKLNPSIAPENLLVWDESRENPSLAFAMAQLESDAQPLGVLRAIDKPAYEDGVIAQLKHAEEKRGTGRLDQLIHSGDIWEVNGQSGGAS